MPKFSSRSRKNLIGVHPQLVKILEEAIKDTPVDFTITEGVRTATQQIALYAIGRRGIPGERRVTDKDGVKNKSNHQIMSSGFGHAVDLYPYYDDKVQVTGPLVASKLSQIALHIKKTAQKLGFTITWGGDWKMVDRPHFEIRL